MRYIKKVVSEKNYFNRDILLKENDDLNEDKVYQILLDSAKKELDQM